MQLGQFTIRSFVEKLIAMDGGAMFGIVPKILWSQLINSDGENRIPMCTNLFVVEAHGKQILFESGLGDTLSDAEQKVYGTDNTTMMESGLKSLGLTPEDIDIVILTHLHTDHMAGSVKFDGDRLVPRFPNATFVASKSEYDVATNPNERTDAVYKRDRVLALEEAGALELIMPDIEYLPGIMLLHCGGHTQGHFGIEIESEGQSFFYYGDLIPMSYHLKLPYIAALDLFPLETMEAKRALVPRMIEKNVALGLLHDRDYPVVTMSGDPSDPDCSKVTL
jgi:glyoxylase-like metal-dependent hydrolase (beta-lactamase superfamily II)